MSSEVWANKSLIQNFYGDKSILLTGGTGFLGKVLVEKLLRSCPDIRHIYLLVREKDGVGAEDRLHDLFGDKVFSRVKKENPQIMEKVTAVVGDLCQPGLGLEPTQHAMLRQQVDIVLHSAATVKFNERLRLAVATNVTATRQLCLLARDMLNLKAFVYVSTAYSNCEKAVIPEIVCSPPITPESLSSLVESLDDVLLNNITDSLLDSKPNTYIFTKSVAEEVVNRFGTSLPMAILRPSVVVASASEPVAGWLDNAQGTSAFVSSLLAGLLHTAPIHHSARANVVPVDFVANAIIGLAYVVGKKQWHQDDEGVPVINYVATTSNPLTWKKFERLSLKYARKHPSQRILWYPFCTTAHRLWALRVKSALLHHLPAVCIDFMSSMVGRPTKLRNKYRYMERYTSVITYFALNNFKFEERNAGRLWDLLEPQDQQLFPFNMAALNWDSFFSGYVLGCRQYLLREDPSTLAYSRRRLRMLYLLHVLVKGAFFYTTLKFLLYISKLVLRKTYRTFPLYRIL